MKLDAKFNGVIFKVKDRSIVPDDEYVVFLAKDDAFAAILPKYLEECRGIGCDEEQLDAVGRMINRVTAWRLANSNRCHAPDAAGERMLDR